MRKALQNPDFERPLAAPDYAGGNAGWAAVIAPNGKPILTIEEVIQKLTRTGLVWNGVGNNPTPSAGLNTITYGFFDTAAQVYSQEQGAFQPLSATQREAMRQAFAIWGDYLAITFVEGPVTSADINIGNLVTSDTHFSAYASYPDKDREGGDMWFSTNSPTNQQIGLGEAGIRTIMHEIGHALGLSHPGNYNAAPNVDITYEANAEYFQDSHQYTIMSYFGSINTGAVRTGFAATPLAHDIAAMQSLYGVNMTTRTGDTVYGFNSNAGRAAFDFTQNTAPVVAIWDAGGRDTLDFSGWSSASRIDLNPGASSDGGGQTFNVQIAYGAIIENAIGGGGNDVISGNAATNVLIGGGGNDTLTGGEGNDRAEGGAGADIFVFAATGHSTDYVRRSDGEKFMPDVLADFTSGLDKIDLSAIDAITGTPGDDAFAFIGTAAFSNQAGQLRWGVQNGFVHILGDVNGDGFADIHIVASGTQVLAGDFVL